MSPSSPMRHRGYLTTRGSNDGSWGWTRWSQCCLSAIREAGGGPVHIRALADQTWAEDDDGSAALLRQHAARTGVTARIDLTAADLPGKTALVATGHAIALISGVLKSALRTDGTTVSLVAPRPAASTRSHHAAIHTRPRRTSSTRSRRP
jgi:hypothetical protein